MPQFGLQQLEIVPIDWPETLPTVWTLLPLDQEQILEKISSLTE